LNRVAILFIFPSSVLVVEMSAMLHFSSPGHQQQQQKQLNHHQQVDRDLPPPPPEHDISSSGASNSLELRFSHSGHLDSSPLPTSVPCSQDQPPPPPTENGVGLLNRVANNSPTNDVLNSISSGPPQLRKMVTQYNPKDDVRLDLLRDGNAQNMEDTKMMLESQKKDMEKKIKILEADLMQSKKDMSAAVRAWRTAKNEHEKLALELSNANSKGSLALEEKNKAGRQNRGPGGGATGGTDQIKDADGRGIEEQDHHGSAYCRAHQGERSWYQYPQW